MKKQNCGSVAKRGGVISKLLYSSIFTLLLIFTSTIFIGCGTVAKSSSGSSPVPVDNFVVLPGGEVTLGGDYWDNPLRTVSLSPFAMAKYQTTQSDFEKIMGYNKSYFSGKSHNPVEMVSWYEAVQYSLYKTLASDDVSQEIKDEIEKWLIPTENFVNQDMTGDSWFEITVDSGDFAKCMAYLSYARITNGCYRLPTEAEWEYALRAGTTTAYIWGTDTYDTYSEEDEMSANAHGWNENNNTSEGFPDGTKEVGKKQANAFGLYDMLGNVWEWCMDTFTWEGLESLLNNPVHTEENTVWGQTRCVVRGGAWNGNSSYGFCSASRDFRVPSYRGTDYGFRVARTVK